MRRAWLRDMRTQDRSFTPPFCPNPDCGFHRDPMGWQWKRDGFFRRRAPPRRIRRFRCVACRRCFSTQTFDTTYWLKRPDLQRPLHFHLVSCVAFRQGARMMGVAPSTLQRQASRLGRHCLLFQQLHGPKTAPREPVALDGFLTFEFSQYWPFEINHVVGVRSHFVYGFTDAELRRSGRMRTDQKEMRRRLEDSHGRPDPKATRRSVEQLIRIVAPDGGGFACRSDRHGVYPRAFAALPHAIQHSTVSSRRRRDGRNPLFAINLSDTLLRHSSANHKRETIAFSKRRQGALERMANYQVWRNFEKRSKEGDPYSRTPAQLIGIQRRRLKAEDVLARRLFPSRVPLPRPLDTYYARLVPTRQIPGGTRHELKYAA